MRASTSDKFDEAFDEFVDFVEEWNGGLSMNFKEILRTYGHFLLEQSGERLDIEPDRSIANQPNQERQT